jgi:hypothetical protein
MVAVGTLVALLASMQPAIAPAAPQSSLSKQVASAAEAWRKAVLAQNTPRLAAFAWPEEQAMVRRDMERESVLSKALWGWPPVQRQSIAGLLADERTLRQVVFTRHPLSEVQRRAFRDSNVYATSCFHTRPVEWPTTYAELHRVSDGKSVLCLDWIQDGAAWRLDYSFGYPDDGDEK